MISGLGHVGIICDDFMKMRDFYTRVIGLTITDEDPERGSCFLSADPEHEHHELNLGQSRGPDHPDGARLKTQGLGQVSFIVPGMDDLRTLYDRFQKEGTRILRTVTHGISVSIYFLDSEANAGEVYYKTGYIVREGFSRPIDFEKQCDDEILVFSRSLEATIEKRRLAPSRAPSSRWGRQIESCLWSVRSRSLKSASRLPLACLPVV